MADYSLFDSEKFMHDPFFRSWISKTSLEAEVFWTGWLVSHPEKKEEVNQAKAWLLAIWAEFDKLTPEEEVRYVSQIKKEREKLPVAGQKEGRSTRRGWQWAAGVYVGVSLIGLIYILSIRSPVTNSRPLTHQQAIVGLKAGTRIDLANPGNSPKRVILPDGSTITLTQHSRLSYSSSISTSAQRRVYLAGEAFFEVVRNPTRPFLVYANGVVTKVLGTSFRIISGNQKIGVRVQVRSGRVSVFATRHQQRAATLFDELQDGIVLTPNQEVTLTKEHNLIKSIVPRPLLLDPQKTGPKRAYIDTPLKHIFDDIKAAYGIDIIYDESTFDECLLTAQLDRESLFQQIELICKSVGATYTVMDGRIVISGSGCR